MNYNEMTKQQMRDEIDKLKKEITKVDLLARYEETAVEVKTIQMAYVKAGFTEDQAFELLMLTLKHQAKM